MKSEKVVVKIDGMVCTSCEKRVEGYIKTVPNVISVKANYVKGNATIEYIKDKYDDINLCKSLENTEYSIAKNTKDNEIPKVIGIIILCAIVIFLGTYSGSFNISEYLNSNVSFLILFIIGIFSSLHCIGMCGGISMSQGISIANSSKRAMLKPSLLYNLGRLISYSIIGGVIGSIGSVFKISDNLQAGIFIFSSVFMIIMGFNIFGLKIFRKFTLKLPFKKSNQKTPFIVGLLNGFMPCGPLQTMQLYALTTGSFIFGFLSMFFFALGTIPLMLTFGVLSNLFNKKASKTILKFSGILIIFIGLTMGNRGLALVGYDVKTVASEIISPISKENTETKEVQKGSKAKIENGVQTVTITANSKGYSPKNVYIEKGVKTDLIVNGEKLTSCNNQIKIPSLKISKKLNKGENTISFTPKESETISYSCWMGMISGKIVVVDDLDTIKEKDSDTQSSTENSSAGQYFGMPIGNIPTNRLVKKLEINGDMQNLTISSEKNDLEPAVIIGNPNMKINLNFILEENSTLNGEYSIYNQSLNKVISTFKIENNKSTINIEGLSSGSYPIVYNNKLLAIIEITKDFDNINLEEIRNNYFN